MSTPNNERAQALIDGKRTQVICGTLKEATALRIAGWRLGRALRISKHGSEGRYAVALAPKDGKRGRPLLSRKKVVKAKGSKASWSKRHDPSLE